MPADPAATDGNGRAAAAKLTVYHLARLIFTESALSGPELEAHQYTETFETTDRAAIDEALAKIEASNATPSDAVLDARWGLVFSDASGARVRTLYLNRFGTTAELDGERVTFSGRDLIDWLRAKYGADSVLA